MAGRHYTLPAGPEMPRSHDFWLIVALKHLFKTRLEPSLFTGFGLSKMKISQISLGFLSAQGQMSTRQPESTIRYSTVSTAKSIKGQHYTQLLAFVTSKLYENCWILA